MDFISSKNKNSIFDNLKTQLYTEQLREKKQAYIDLQGGDLEEALDVIESDYTFNLFKLDEVAELASISSEKQKKFIELKLYIEDMGISKKAKLQTILTSAGILNRAGTRTQDLDNQEFFLLSAIMVPIQLEDYRTYGDVLSHPTILKSTTDKTQDLNEQLDILNSVLDYCDRNVYEDMLTVDYKRAISDSVKIVHKFQIQPKKNVSKGVL